MFLFEIKEEEYEHGKIEQKSELILNMLKNGASPEKISELTDVPLNEVQQILDGSHAE